MMKAGPLRARDKHNCNCDHEIGFSKALRAGDGAAVVRYMRAKHLDVCFVEDLRWWPTPEKLAILTQHVRLATTLRDPWTRLLSNYERDTVICGGCGENSSLHSYMFMQGCYHSIRYSVQLPDFYVRALAGKAKSDVQQVETLNNADLDAAKGALRAFEACFVLEDADYPMQISALARLATVRTDVHLSNNRYSGTGGGGSSSHVKTSQNVSLDDGIASPPWCITAAHSSETQLRAQWLNVHSKLDARLYAWAAARRREEKEASASSIWE